MTSHVYYSSFVSCFPLICPSEFGFSELIEYLILNPNMEINRVWTMDYELLREDLTLQFYVTYDLIFTYYLLTYSHGYV